MISWAKDLFPIARSLTGNGVRKTFSYLQDINPEIQTYSFATGTDVFDWTIPREWNMKSAFIEHIETGKRFAEFETHNLHILGYSLPIDKVMDRTELLPHIYTQPDQPDLIPYVTSYYKDRWGFCMSHNEKNALPEGDYRVFVDSELFDGELLVGDALIQGETDQEVMFSSYVCHPSMANNELSGPVLISALLKYVKETYPKPKSSYRFILVPETIGSVAYMSRNLEEMQQRVVCGFNLSCVGDERAFSHVESRYGNNLADNALRSALVGRDNVETYSFLHRGSDERQYCAPGIDLPVCGFCRTKYGEFPEYHTDADNFDLVTQNGLMGSFEIMCEIIDAFEIGLYPRVLVKGEPQLGKRGLYPTISQKGSYSSIRARMDFLAYADGTNTLFEIAERIGVPLSIVLNEAHVMLEHELIETKQQSLSLC
jgi:aminopeptidase-like protein